MHYEKLDRLLDLILYFMHGYEVYNDGDLEIGVLSQCLPIRLGIVHQLLDKLNEERSHVSDVIRQEFADRIVATEEENRRIKTEMSELRVSAVGQLQ